MKFIAPAHVTSISHEQDVFPVENGFVDLPPAIGRELELTAAPTDSAPKKDKKEK